MKQMTFININSDISLIKECYKDLILDTLVNSENDVISWKNYSPGVSKKMYAREFEDLKNNRQYSFPLIPQHYYKIFFLST